MIEYRTTLEGINEAQLEGFFVGWRSPISPSQHLTILQNSTHVVLAYDTERDKVVGFINALSDKVNFAFIPMLEVLPEYQRQGIGRELMERMLKELEPIACIDLMCDEDMQTWYEKLGMLRSHGMVIRKYV